MNYAVPPLVHAVLTSGASSRANTRPRGNGRTRCTPTGHRKVPFGCRLRRVFAESLSPPFTIREFSLQRDFGYFSASLPYLCVF